MVDLREEKRAKNVADPSIAPAGARRPYVLEPRA
jgi:hypothetical protein